ncbi:MAG: hypothetical protein A3F11_02820 [Gammaproteobacteria bacterium RIFCSPHIGHO2_12_FULL_37_14]|nr:MAG: hypothetical protein A3F11_02820 [Gammaproteobacteria bacterium RIFCSPHIGHO2_12_FULL_37_14]
MSRPLKIVIAFIGALLLANSGFAAGLVKGIYITQGTLEDTSYLNYLIKQAKEVGIDTFVIDFELPSKRYQNNIAIVKANHINYVARIIVFPKGGTPEQVASEAYREKKYALIKQAVNMGADEIQLDYIRYNTQQKPSAENARNILKVIQWYKNKLSAQNIPLQVDVFGITSFGESFYIGQNLQLFSQTLDAICPMVYPSHYFPYREHAEKPYETISDSLRRIKSQFDGKPPFKIYPYIEVYNFRYPSMSHNKLLSYIREEIRAVQDAGVNGFYVWSPHNKYDNLFTVLKTMNTDTNTAKEPTSLAAE